MASLPPLPCWAKTGSGGILFVLDRQSYSVLVRVPDHVGPDSLPLTCLHLNRTMIVAGDGLLRVL